MGIQLKHISIIILIIIVILIGQSKYNSKRQYNKYEPNFNKTRESYTDVYNLEDGIYSFHASNNVQLILSSPAEPNKDSHLKYISDGLVYWNIKRLADGFYTIYMVGTNYPLTAYGGAKRGNMVRVYYDKNPIPSNYKWKFDLRPDGTYNIVSADVTNATDLVIQTWGGNQPGKAIRLNNRGNQHDAPNNKWILVRVDRESFDYLPVMNTDDLSVKAGTMGKIGFPDGMILPFYGHKETIQNMNGWILCDGLNGTPDLRGRFVRMCNENSTGVVLRHPCGESGGSDSTKLTVENLPPHSHIIPKERVILRYKAAAPGNGMIGWEPPKDNKLYLTNNKEQSCSPVYSAEVSVSNYRNKALNQANEVIPNKPQHINVLYIMKKTKRANVPAPALATAPAPALATAPTANPVLPVPNGRDNKGRCVGPRRYCI